MYGMFICILLETETFVQANLKPIHKPLVQSPKATVQKLPEVPQKEPVPAQQVKTQEEIEKEKEIMKSSAQGLSPAVITTLLLLLPLVLVIAIGVFIRWKKSRMYGGN